MAANCLTISELDEQDFQLLAVHTVLQDYKLAYLLNKELSFFFTRIVPDVDYVIDGKKALFSSYEFKDTKNLVDWYLIANKFKVKKAKSNDLDLFYTEELFSTSYVYLQPEIKEVDFIIKVQGDFLESKLENTLKEINKLNGVLTTYLVDTYKLNHKEYLIF